MRGVRYGLAAVAVATAAIRGTAAPETRPVFDVPRLDNVVIDGDPSDWGDAGFRVGIVASPEGKVKPGADFTAGFRLGWNEKGLLLLVGVRDDKAFERNADLWDNDGIEVFVARKPGDPVYYQAILNPGIDPAKPELTKRIADHRKPAGQPELTVEAARQIAPTGTWSMEVLLPWANLGIAPKGGSLAGFQLYINDADGPGNRFQAVWYPENGTHADSSRMQRIRLAEQPSEPIVAVAGGAYETWRRTRVRVTGIDSLDGKTVEVLTPGRAVGKGQLRLDDGWTSATVDLAMPAPGAGPQTYDVRIDGQRITTVTLPDADTARAKAVLDLAIVHRPSVFFGDAFPPVEFREPSLAEDLIGPNKIEAKYYDAAYNEVSAPTRPGRYGAVVTVTPERGRPFRRFVTLYRQPEDFPFWREEMAGTIGLPPALGVDPAVLAAQPWQTGEMVKWLFFDTAWQADSPAVFLAGMAETRAGEPIARRAEDAWTRDRQWWVGLKRRLYGNNAKIEKTPAAPQTTAGGRAPELRLGTVSEAGMKPETVAKLDALLTAWSADTDEAFAVCAARRGVVFYHKAYGTRNGKPMTTETPSYMASITKLLAGTLTLPLIDQGFVSLDDPVARFLPPFDRKDVRKTLLLRHLFTHTSGLWGHWGDDMTDFEERIGAYYPTLEVGKRYEYNGTGLALAGKVIEQVTGDALPRAFRRYLLDPLGCTHTEVTTMSWDTQSTPLDIAKIGQLLLNRGAYGDKRFFSEAAFPQLLPEKLTKVLGPSTTVEYGMGTSWFRNEGLGEGTFGHGAASSATLRIDPSNDLVIVMTRNAAGKNFAKYHPQFLKTIAEGVER